MFQRFVGITLVLTAASVQLSAEDEVSRIRSGHNLLQEEWGKSAIETGIKLKPLAWKNIAGDAIYLEDCLERGPAVFVFLSGESFAGKFRESFAGKVLPRESFARLPLDAD